MAVLERAVRAAARMREDPRERRGLATAIASGVAVSMPVARTFLGLDTSLGGWVLGAALLGGLAMVCTAGGTFLAIRASSTKRAVLWVLGANVVPPTLVCAPTIYGLLISVPSGVAAFAAVLPFALYARRALRSERSGHLERDRLTGALLVAISALGLAAYELLLADPYPGCVPVGEAWRCIPPFESPFEAVLRRSIDLVPAAVASLTALTLSGLALARDGRRAWIAASVRRGEVRGYRLGEESNGSAAVERVEEVGAGPMRAAPTLEPVGAIPRSSLRLVAALATSTLAAAALGAAGSLALGL